MRFNHYKLLLTYIVIQSGAVTITKLSEHSFEDYYFSPKDNVVQTFFIPALQSSVRYDRASGYFTSYSLIEVSIGICSMVSRGGKIRVLTSPNLTVEDLQAIRNGYDIKEQVGLSMVRDFEEPSDLGSLDRLSFVSELISRGMLDIKVVLMRNLDDYPTAVFHPKFGIMHDSFGNAVSFTGSMNETRNGLGGNWETVEVTSSDKDGFKKINQLQKIFDDLWNNEDEDAFVIEMPEVVSKLISNYSTGELRLDLDDRLAMRTAMVLQSVYFKSPDYLECRPYQRGAVSNWINGGYRGIFNMATGTGKTKTALLALEQLYNNNPDEGIFTIIVAPQKHLVDQWAREVQSFGVTPLIGHSDSADRNWKDRFKTKALLRKQKRSNSCLITTISSFSSPDVQKWLDDLGPLAIVLDEAHNMGSALRLTKLPENAKYRLALSATLERFKDAKGTESLRNYFGTECINLPLESVIGRYLSNYHYHPIPCSYNELEYSQFIENNERLDAILSNPHSSKILKINAKREYIEYSYTLNIRMESKYESLKALMGSLDGIDHFLVYCGKAKTDPEDDCCALDHKEMVDSIDRVVQVIGKNGLGFDVSRITYRETSDDRKRIIDEFDRGDISGMVAISCLDEGVDVPSITAAIFMSSSDNPREYVQRRGRVLRLHPGKDHSDIYDMVVMPRPIEDVHLDDSHSGLELKMIAKELRRMIEFSRVSLNPDETEMLMRKIECAYSLSVDDILEEYGEDYDE